MMKKGEYDKEGEEEEDNEEGEKGKKEKEERDKGVEGNKEEEENERREWIKMRKNFIRTIIRITICSCYLDIFVLDIYQTLRWFDYSTRSVIGNCIFLLIIH